MQQRAASARRFVGPRRPCLRRRLAAARALLGRRRGGDVLKLAPFAALMFLGLGACSGDSPAQADEIDSQARSLGSVSQAATASVPVTVVNAANDPVPTTVKGTAQVAGTVGLTAGTTVNVGNAVTLGGQPTVGI